ncbi:hypothetical protein ACFWAT_08110 [Streptomyces syringium]|uniref:hypothetical protein n=1 Tax=Streptomyces syringium TaxID=76729 RepID=UPI00365EF405
MNRPGAGCQLYQHCIRTYSQGYDGVVVNGFYDTRDGYVSSASGPISQYCHFCSLRWAPGIDLLGYFEFDVVSSDPGIVA